MRRISARQQRRPRSLTHLPIHEDQHSPCPSPSVREDPCGPYASLPLVQVHLLCTSTRCHLCWSTRPHVNPPPCTSSVGPQPRAHFQDCNGQMIPSIYNTLQVVLPFLVPSTLLLVLALLYAPTGSFSSAWLYLLG